VLLDAFKTAVEQKKIIDLQFHKINERVRSLYERFNFQTIGKTELLYQMRFEVK
jgi:ribosomal protein S18 acetylase RimI-like enzyme